MTAEPPSLQEAWDSAIEKWSDPESYPDYPNLSGLDKGFINNTAPITVIGDIAVIAVPSEYIKRRIEQNLSSSLTKILSSELQHDIQLNISVQEQLAEQLNSAPSAKAHSVGGSAPDINDVLAPSTPMTPSPSVEPFKNSTGLTNPNLTFNNFVAGPSNKMSLTAAMAVAESPGQTYNPLFIWGDSGLGKTHLLHAVSNYVKETSPDKNVVNISTEALVNDYVNSMGIGSRKKNAEEYDQRYRSADVLIVDDIQVLEGKIETQNSFFNIFNELMIESKQIVIASDRSPENLGHLGLDRRMTTRFAGGLTTDIQTPTIETRMAILALKAKELEVELPEDPNPVLEYIASKQDRSVRELEGALMRVIAWAGIEKKPISLELAQEALQTMSPSDGHGEITTDSILDTVGNYYDFSVSELLGKSRTKPLATARQIVMYLAKDLTDLSLVQIGRDLGNREHSTVKHGYEKIREEMPHDRGLLEDIEELTRQITTTAQD